METNKTALMWRKRGAIFQFPMIALWGTRGVLLSLFMGTLSWSNFLNSDPATNFGIADTLWLIGLGLMVVCMLRIYHRPTDESSRTLITSDVFAITRHPMYHGMFIADSALFFVADLTHPFFWMSWIVFVILILTAGWFQEKETLANWGDEAKEYYRRTPRFIFEWLWFWAIRPKAV